ncbi:MAG: prepilin-type N-terminal cleavage/methylation domain-containing protein [Candidatus Omnitrophica bacterium]|nr:prepilin-type N-terminal cleavage/methylation domain-containing protein [Candidatus Omnitrophota bacterium]
MDFFKQILNYKFRTDIAKNKSGKIFSAGFTFIELLVALTIFSIIAVSVYAVFHAGVKMWFKTNILTDDTQTKRVFFNTISRDLKNAISYTKGGVNFQGAPQRISFMTTMEVAGQDAPLHWELAKVVYVFDKDSQSVKRLVATKQEGLDEAKARSEEFFQNIKEKDFGFTYCYKDPYSVGEVTYQWQDAWHEQAKIPRGVRVNLGELRKVILLPTGELGTQQ